jgi:cytoskeletal protein CcmA (bactofilin family)
MFDKKKDLTDEISSVFRPAKGSSKVVIGEGVNIKGEITNAEEVQIDGIVDIVLKTENINVGPKGILNGSIEAKNADIWGKVAGDLKISNTLTVQELGHVSGKIEYSQLQIKLGGSVTGELVKTDKKINKSIDPGETKKNTELDNQKSLLQVNKS